MNQDGLKDVQKIRVPRGAFFLTVLIIGLLLSIISDNLTFGPSWTVLLIVAILIIPLVISMTIGHHGWTRAFTLCITGVVTVGLISSVAFLIHSLFHHTASAASLFRSAGLLWFANIGVFAVWYWEIDRGGPIKRHLRKEELPDFLFPQMTTRQEELRRWMPTFLDYVFLAFNTNTAFSPTDTMILSKKAKILVMIQSSISLLIVAVLAARAVNIA